MRLLTPKHPLYDPIIHLTYFVLFCLAETVVWVWHFADGVPMAVTVFGHVAAFVSLAGFLLRSLTWLLREYDALAHQARITFRER